MKTIELPKNPESVSLTLTQTSKGYWYVDRATIFAAEIKEAIEKMKNLTTETIKLLLDLNKNGKEE